MSEELVTSHDPLPPLSAFVMSLRLQGADYWYAILIDVPDIDDDPAYCHGAGLPLYRDRDALLADLGADGIPVGDGWGRNVDVDRARTLIRYEMSRDDIDEVITAWNALDDLTAALGRRLDFHGALANKVYDKLFWGLNLPAVTPAGKWYIPLWRPKERAKMDQVLRECGAKVSASMEAR